MMKKTILALALMGAASPAFADAWLYAGVNYGSVNYSGSDVASDQDSETSYGLNVGTGILPFIGVEAGYWNLGEVDGSDINSLYAAIKPSIDIGPIELYAKAGVHKYQIDEGNTYEKDDDYNVMYGIGAEYTVIDNIPLGSISLGLSYNHFSFDKFDANSYSLSATLHFL